MKINGVAHVILRVTRFDECVAFYDQLMPELGLTSVHRSPYLAYYVGGRTAFGIRPPDADHADHEHIEQAPGIEHLCFRARSREDVDAVHRFVVDELHGHIVHPPEDGGFAPGYYSVLFEDPDGIRIEVNHVPGKGHFGPEGRLGAEGEGPSSVYADSGLSDEPEKK